MIFESGARVAFKTTPVAEGVVFFGGRSAGGSSVLDDGDVGTGVVAANVVDGSGAGDFDPVAIDAFLSDKEVSLRSAIDLFTEGFFGSSATSDLETIFQLIHLRMTQPRVDAVTLEQYIDEQLPLAEDPSINPNYAQVMALTEVRYDDLRYQLLDVDDLVEAGIDITFFEDRPGHTYQADTGSLCNAIDQNHFTSANYIPAIVDA